MSYEHPTSDTAGETARDLIARLLPAGIGIAEAAVADYAAGLFPEEAAYIAKAVSKRRNEFSTGRMLARRALHTVGGPQVAIPSGEYMAPVWPAGFVGSITHTSSHAAAAVARAADLQGIGIDLEVVSRVSLSLVSKIATEQEQEVLRASAEPVRDLALLYSAKESWFKCQYPLTKTYLGFEDAAILFDWSNGEFAVRLTQEGNGIDLASRARCRFAFDDQHVATTATLTT
jgi:4'-phosphopantetheinyl transferase EntD